MTAKNFLCIVLSLSMLLSIPCFGFILATGQEFDRYYMDILPPRDANGNFTLEGEDGWIISGEGVLEGNITISDNAIVAMHEADVTINGTIWAQGNAKIIIRRSQVRINVPSSGPVLIENQYDEPYGFILLGKRTSLLIEDSDVYLHRYDRYETVPVIPEGMTTPGEIFVSFGKFKVTNSFLDTSSTVSFPGINNSVNRGMKMHEGCEIEIADSDLTAAIEFVFDSHGIIEETNFRAVTLRKNTKDTPVTISNSILTHSIVIAQISKITFQNCQLESSIYVMDDGEVFLQNTSVRGMRLTQNGTVTFDASDFSVEPPYPGWTHAWDNSSMVLMNSSFIKHMYLNDNSSIYMYGSEMNSVTATDTSFISLRHSNIDNVAAGENSTLWIQASEIKNHSLSQHAKICNITTLSVSTSLNLQPISVLVDLKNSEKEIIESKETDDHGNAEFTLIRDIISINQTNMELEKAAQNVYYYAAAGFENLFKEEEVSIDGYFEEINLSFEDYKPPTITKLNYKIDPFVNMYKETTVRAHITDEETNLKSVILRYSVNDGKTWEELAMVKIGQDTYEHSIPGQRGGTRVRFNIMAVDKCGNIAESRFHSHLVGENVVIFNNTLIITVLSIFIAMACIKVAKLRSGRSKVKKYLHKTETQER
jgi:hypothetical protein